MTHPLRTLLIAVALSAAALPAFAQVGVSINVGEPGFYGQIHLGNAPAPVLLYPRPVIVAPAPEFAGVAPIYLRVPPGYAKHWRRHCAAYRACGRPVYFVTSNWYLDHYVPYYRGHHEHHERNDRHGHGHWEHGRDHGRDHDHHDGHGHHGHHD